MVISLNVLAYGQSGEIYLSVAMPQNCILDGNSKTILKNKLLGAASANGVAATECSAIVMVPEISVADEGKVEGTMRTIYTRQLDVALTVRNVITNTVFCSMQMTCSGEGYSHDEANRSAIRKIDTNSSRYRSFVENAKKKIVEYYANNTSTLIAKANNLAARQLYDEALALLSTYPESLSGYTQIATAMDAIFKKSQTKYCSEIMQSARAAYAQRDFAMAADIASTINSQSSCAAEAKELLAQIKHDVDKEHNDEVAMQREQYRDKVAMEHERIKANEREKTAASQAAAEIAKAYYQRQTQYIYFW